MVLQRSPDRFVQIQPVFVMCQVEGAGIEASETLETPVLPLRVVTEESSYSSLLVPQCRSRSHWQPQKSCD
jgi:hypothetical protein